MGSFDCCRDCKPPKRHIGCHADCKPYIEAKAEHNKRKEYDSKHQPLMLRNCDFNKIGFANMRRRKKK